MNYLKLSSKLILQIVPLTETKKKYDQSEGWIFFPQIVSSNFDQYRFVNSQAIWCKLSKSVIFKDNINEMILNFPKSLSSLLTLKDLQFNRGLIFDLNNQDTFRIVDTEKYIQLIISFNLKDSKQQLWVDSKKGSDISGKINQRDQPFATVSAALKSLPFGIPGIIYLAPGTYSEKIILPGQIHLIGSGISLTFLFQLVIDGFNNRVSNLTITGSSSPFLIANFDCIFEQIELVLENYSSSNLLQIQNSKIVFRDLRIQGNVSLDNCTLFNIQKAEVILIDCFFELSLPLYFCLFQINTSRVTIQQGFNKLLIPEIAPTLNTIYRIEESNLLVTNSLIQLQISENNKLFPEGGYLWYSSKNSTIQLSNNTYTLDIPEINSILTKIDDSSRFSLMNCSFSGAFPPRMIGNLNNVICSGACPHNISRVRKYSDCPTLTYFDNTVILDLPIDNIDLPNPIIANQQFLYTGTVLILINSTLQSIRLNGLSNYELVSNSCCFLQSCPDHWQILSSQNLPKSR